MGFNSGFKGLTVEITLHVAQTVNTEQLQHCIYRRNVVCFRYIVVHTVHKGYYKDNDDDDDDDNYNSHNNRYAGLEIYANGNSALNSARCCLFLQPTATKFLSRAGFELKGR